MRTHKSVQLILFRLPRQKGQDWDLTFLSKKFDYITSQIQVSESAAPNRYAKKQPTRSKWIIGNWLTSHGSSWCTRSAHSWAIPSLHYFPCISHTLRLSQNRFQIASSGLPFSFCSKHQCCCFSYGYLPLQ